MARREITGDLGADGIKGGQALADAFDEYVAEREPVHGIDTEQGLSTRLRYLTRSKAGYKAMEEAGIRDSRRLEKWLAEDITPSSASLAKIDQAYQSLRRRNLKPALKRRLNEGGRTNVQIYPVNQDGVEEKYKRRNLGVRETSIRASTGIWDQAVDAWIAGDEEALDDTWDLVLEELDSDRDAYAYVSGIAVLYDAD